ncbi:MAG: hypothetical protein ACRCSN_20780, partial [Dermatophilaceae bacterium]
GGLDADHGDDEDHQVELVPASIAKGVEFDPGRSSSSRARSSPPSPTSALASGASTSSSPERCPA